MKEAYVLFYNGDIPHCPLAWSFFRKNPTVKDKEGLIGDKSFREFYPFFVSEYGEFPYYGVTDKKLLIFCPLRNENDRERIFKDFEAIKKIVAKNGVKNLYVNPVYPIKFFYFYLSSFPVKNLFFVAFTGERFKVVSTLAPNPFLSCKGGGGF